MVTPVRRRKMRPEEVDAQLRLMETIGNMNPSSPEPRLLAAPGDPLFAESYYQGSSGGVSNQTRGARRIGKGVLSSGMTTAGTYGTPLMLGPAPGQQEVVKPAFAYKPGRGAMIGGRVVSQEEFDSAWQRRGSTRPGVPPPKPDELFNTVATRVIPNTIPVAPSVVPGSNLPDDRPSVWSSRARQSMFPSATGTQVRYRNPDGSLSVESMPIVGGGVNFSGIKIPNLPLQNKPPVVPGTKLPPVVNPPHAPPVPAGPNATQIGPISTGNPAYPAGAPQVNPVPAVPPTGVQLEIPGKVPVTNPGHPDFKGDAGGLPATPTAPVTPTAPAAGGFPWGRTGMVGGAALGTGVLGYAMGSGDQPIAPVPLAGPGEDQVYNSRMYGETLDPVVAANRARYESKLAQREALATDRGIGRGERRDIRLGKARADVLARYGLASSPEMMAAMYGAQQKAVADQAEPMLMSQVAQRNQMMTALQAQWGVATTPEERARIEQQMQQLNAQPFVTPQGQTPSQFQQSLFPRTPVAPSMVTSVRPKAPAIPPPGTRASGESPTAPVGGRGLGEKPAIRSDLPPGADPGEIAANAAGQVQDRAAVEAWDRRQSLISSGDPRGLDNEDVRSITNLAVPEPQLVQSIAAKYSVPVDVAQRIVRSLRFRQGGEFDMSGFSSP